MVDKSIINNSIIIIIIIIIIFIIKAQVLVHVASIRELIYRQGSLRAKANQHATAAGALSCICTVKMAEAQ